MGSISQLLNSINLENLLALFDFQIALGVLIFFILFRGIFAKIIIKFYYKLTGNKKNAKDSQMFKPLNIFFVLLGVFIMINILPTSKKVLSIMNDIFKVVVIYYLTKAISTLINDESILMKRFFKDSKNEAVNKFLCKIIKVFLWIIATYIALVELGFNLSGFGGLVTGLGIGSAAIALAAQDIVKSMLSGITILTDKPFVIGDWIEVGVYQGTVIDITFRSVRIKSYNNAVITIPNSTITTTYVINWNRLTSRRFDLVLGVSLETPAEKIQKIVRAFTVVLQNDPNVIKETVSVHLNEITASSSDIKIFLYVREADYEKFLKAKQSILCELLTVIDKENVDLAYPTQTLYVKNKGELD